MRFYRVKNARLFFNEVGKEFWRDNCLNRAAGLAYVNLLTFIPLLASLSFFLANLIAQNWISIQEHLVSREAAIEKLAVKFLPYSTGQISAYLFQFVDNARTIGGIGLLLLFALSFGLFDAMENTFNAIWREGRKRSFPRRAIIFFAVFFLAPACAYIFFYLNRLQRVESWVAQALGAQIAPLLVNILAFSFLYYIIPSSRVRPAAALLGGAAAGLLVDLGRLGFQTFVVYSITISKIYGSLGVVPLFLVSLYLFWVLVLWGMEVAYTFQNYKSLRRALKGPGSGQGRHLGYLAVRSLIYIAGRERRGLGPPTVEEIAGFSKARIDETFFVLRQMSRAEIIVQKRGGYSVSRPLARVNLGQVFESIGTHAISCPSKPEDEVRAYLERLFDRQNRQIKSGLTAITLKMAIDDLKL